MFCAVKFETFSPDFIKSSDLYTLATKPVVKSCTNTQSQTAIGTNVKVKMRSEERNESKIYCWSVI